MLRTPKTSSRALKACVLGLATFTSIIVLTTSSADARRRHHGGGRHHVARSSGGGGGYNPQFSSIMVDANSGAVLSSTNADGLRHPASLTKIMTLYLLFERLDSGKMSLDTEMPVSEHASDQEPTKLGVRPGQTLKVEDAIKGIVTRSANDAAVVIGEAIAGDEDDFAKLMTRKARALGMSRTLYRNASGLPNDEQVTTARDQSVLGRAIQDRFPRYFRYFSTAAFNYHGQVIRNHNHLVGSVDGVDGIKTGYTRASGFNLVTSLHRGNRALVGVVLGGRSWAARDATMRGLLAENIDKAATRRTVAAITERNPADANADVAEAAAESRPTETRQVNGAVQVASAAPDDIEAPARPTAPVVAAAPPVSTTRSVIAAATAALPMPPQRKPEPAPFTSGVIQAPDMASAIPGSSEPMKPVRVKTVQVKSGQYRVASAGPGQPGPSTTSTIQSRNDAAETSNSLVSRGEMPPQPANFGTGHGVLGVLPASSMPPQAMAYAEPAVQLQAIQQGGSIKPVATHTGWIIQVGALDSESEARVRLDAAREQAHGLLSKADPFTETVVSKGGEKKLVRARFAGLDRDQAEAVCKSLKRTTISCIAIKN